MPRYGPSQTTEPPPPPSPPKPRGRGRKKFLAFFASGMLIIAYSTRFGLVGRSGKARSSTTTSSSSTVPILPILPSASTTVAPPPPAPTVVRPPVRTSRPVPTTARTVR